MGQFKDFYIRNFEENAEEVKAKNPAASIDMPVRPEGANLLHLAAACGDLEDVSFLLSKGANPNAIDPDGDQALYFAACTNNPNLENDTIIAVTDALIDGGADINHQNRYGCSALFGAILAGDMRFDVLKHLVDRGGNVLARDIRQNSLLSFAVSHDCGKDVAFYLIDQGISPEEIYQGGSVLYLGTPEDPAVIKRSEAEEACRNHAREELGIMRVMPGDEAAQALWS